MSHTLFNRREVIAMCGAGSLAVRDVDAAPDVRFAALDHVAIAVGDVDKSVSFYTRLFGDTVLKSKGTVRRYVKIGPCYVAIATPEQGLENHRVDHFCTAVDGYEPASLKAWLQQRGVAFRDSRLGPFVTDPDGYQIQLWKFDSWSDTARSTAAPESHPINGPPIFQATGLDHVLINVSDPKKSAAYYQQIFGPVAQRTSNEMWFRVGSSRIGLTMASGSRPGVHHFCVAAAAFDYDSIAKKLQQAGIRLEVPEVSGIAAFRDPDGIRVQVIGT